MAFSDRINTVIDEVSRNSWTRGYFCAVAALLRESGVVDDAVRSLFRQGGSHLKADAEDIALFAKHGLIK